MFSSQTSLDILKLKIYACTDAALSDLPDRIRNTRESVIFKR